MKKALYNKANTRIRFLRMSVKNAEIILCIVFVKYFPYAVAYQGLDVEGHE